MKIVVLEDDGLQFESLQHNLAMEFPGVEVELLKTAKDFRDRIPAFCSDPPGLFLIDLMVPWTQLPDEELVPKDFETKVPRLGLVCQQWLTEAEATKNIPVILYTELDLAIIEDTLEGVTGDVQSLRKDDNYVALNRLIRRLSD
jgi:hypothetical protein